MVVESLCISLLREFYPYKLYFKVANGPFEIKHKLTPNITLNVLIK